MEELPDLTSANTEKPRRLFSERIRVLLHYRGLMGILVARDIKLKYRRSFLGYLWSVLDPLFTMIIMAIVFTMMFKRTIPHFPAYLISGNILFGFMRESSSHAITSVTGNASLLKKTYVPKYIFTLSKITSDLVNLFFSFGALLLVIIFTGVPFSWYMLLFWIPILELYVFCVGLGMFLAQLSVFFRDVQYIWNAILMGWLYLTPLFYPIDALPDRVQWLIMRFNPMYYYVTVFRDFMVYQSSAWAPNIWRGAIIAVLALLIGIWSFIRNKDRFILYI